MGRLAVVLGSNALGPGGKEVEASAAQHDVSIMQRHGRDTYTLPHKIDHVANLRALLRQGCDRVLAIGSVGSLSAELPIGSLLCPDDFIALHLGPSVFADEQAFSAPGFDTAWRSALCAAWGSNGGGLYDGGVYWQTIGPRLETPAEISLIAANADVVGMTIASECIVAGELGLAYAAICAVDNLANGMSPRPLSLADIEGARAANARRLCEGLVTVLPQLRAIAP